MEWHVDALFSHDTASRMVAVNEPDGAAAPRLFLGRTPVGNVLRVGAGVSRAVFDEINKVHAREPTTTDPSPTPRRAAAYREALEADARIQTERSGPCFWHPPSDHPVSARVIPLTAETRDRLHPALNDWGPGIEDTQPAFGRLVGDRIVAICASVRVTPSCHEAGVETAPDFRSNGYATQAVKTWVNRLSTIDVVPLYSTTWENCASRRLATKAGFIQYGVDWWVR